MKNVNASINNINAEIITAAVSTYMGEAVKYIGTENGIHYLTPRNGYERGITIVVKEGQAYITNPFGDKPDEDITSNLFGILAGIMEAEQAEGADALAELADIAYMLGHTSFVGVELPMQEVMAAILVEKLVKAGYSLASVMQLKHACADYGEDAHCLPYDVAENGIKQELFAIDPDAVAAYESEEMSLASYVPYTRDEDFAF